MVIGSDGVLDSSLVSTKVFILELGSYYLLSYYNRHTIYSSFCSHVTARCPCLAGGLPCNHSGNQTSSVFCFSFPFSFIQASQVAQWVKNLSEMQEMQFWSLYREDPLECYGNPLQYSCLWNPMDRTWWATVHRVTKSWTWLKRLTEQGVLSSRTWGKIPLLTFGQHKPLPLSSIWKGWVTEFYLHARGLGNTSTGSTVFP